MHLVLQSALPLICLGHCLPVYQYTGELSLQPCILPSVGFHSSGATIWSRTEQLSSHVGQRADMSTAPEIRRRAQPRRNMPPPKAMLQTFGRLQMSRLEESLHATGQVGVAARRGEECKIIMRWCAVEWNIIWVFPTPYGFFWEAERRSRYLNALFETSNVEFKKIPWRPNTRR